MPDLAGLVSSQGEFLQLNRRWQAVLGLQPAELLGRRLTEFVHPDDRPLVQVEMDQLAAGSGAPRFVSRWRAADGSQRWLEWKFSPAAAGQWLGLARDVTECKQAEARWLVSETQLQAVFAHSRDAIGVSRQGRHVFANPAYVAMFGYERAEDLAGTPVLDLIAPESQAQVLANIQARSQGRPAPIDYQVIARRRDGSTFVMEVRVSTYGLPEEIYTLVILRDVTERQRAEDNLRSSFERLRLALEAARAGTWEWDLRTNRDIWSDELWAVYGLEPHSCEPSYDAWRRLIHPDDRERAEQAVQYAARTGTDLQIEWRLRSETGADRTMLSRGRSIAGASNAVERYVGIVMDITESKLAEAALRESEEKFSKAFQYAPSLMTISAVQDGKYLEVNAEFTRISGFSRAEAIGKTSVELGWLAPEDRAKLVASLQAHGRIAAEELTLRAKDGRPVVCLYHGELITVNGQLRLLSIAQDITERKRIEDALLRNEEKYRQLVELTPDGVLIHVGGKIIFANAAAAHLLGPAQPEDLIGRTLMDFVHPDYRGQVAQRVRSITADQHNAPLIEEKLLRLDGGVIDAEVAAIPFQYEALNAVQVIFRDISARKQAEAAVRASALQHSVVLETALDGFWMVDPATRQIIEINEAYCRMSGYRREEILGRTIDQFEVQEQSQNVRAHVRQIEVLGADRFQTVHRRQDGSTYPLEVSVQYLAEGGKMFAFLRDITERKQAEEEIKRSLAEKETLLRELYHRTKNNMAVIVALLELQAEYEAEPRLAEALREAQNRIRSMALVHQKLYDARDLSRVNLKDYIHDLAALLRRSYSLSPGQVEIQFELETVLVLIDSAIPCGLILNELISNAYKYAFPAGRRGRIEIGLRRLEAGVIELRVADDGVGLPPGFDPRRDGHLGVQNVFILGENQLAGQVQVRAQAGLAWEIRFRDDQYRVRV